MPLGQQLVIIVLILVLVFLSDHIIKTTIEHCENSNHSQIITFVQPTVQS